MARNQGGPRTTAGNRARGLRGCNGFFSVFSDGVRVVHKICLSTICGTAWDLLAYNKDLCSRYPVIKSYQRKHRHREVV